MSYIVFRDDPSVHSAQEAERRGEAYWPLLPMGTFGDLGQPAPVRAPARRAPGSGCTTCRRKGSKTLGQAETCPQGQTLTPAGTCVGIDPGTKMRKIGWIVVTASAIAVVGLFAATLTLGTEVG